MARPWITPAGRSCVDSWDEALGGMGFPRQHLLEFLDLLMAEVFSFRAWRFNPARTDLARVVTQPYDKITPAMQDRYYAADPHNLVRIILGRPEPEDNEGRNVYTRAAELFARWQSEQVLIQDPRPSLYFYSQRFRLPGSSKELERQGFIGLGRISDYADGIIFRHEQTLAKPKADRLQLLRATRAHFGQIFVLYSDPARDAEILLGSATLTASSGATRQFSADTAMARDPDMEVTDEHGVLHRVWCIDDPQVVAGITHVMRDKRLIIADGHHRYETALNYRNECRARAAAIDPDAPYERVMMTFINMESPALVILPTHRVIFGLYNFDSKSFAAQAGRYFEVQPLHLGTLEAALQKLRQAGESGTALLAVTADSTLLLRVSPAAMEALQYVPTLLRQLDVVFLHKLLLEAALGISEEAIRNQQNVSYHREAEEAVARVKAGANAAFLLNPVGIPQLSEIAFSGAVLPQKSTDFYPKLLSGLTMYALD